MTRDPYEHLPSPAPFSLASDDLASDEPFPTAQRSAIFGGPGRDISPQLSWSGHPQATRSFVVTMFDGDAATPSGFWHWAVVDIPGYVNGIAAGIGSSDEQLPGTAYHLRNDAGMPSYLGAAPPSGRHGYHVVVHAVDVPRLELTADATPAYLSFLLLERAIGRAVLRPWADA